MSEQHFAISYYKNADAGIHVQRIERSQDAQSAHSHDYYQIYYIARGTLTHVTEGESSRLSRGDTFIIPPGRTHYIRELSDTLFYTLSFTRESLGTEEGTSRLALRFLKDIEKEAAPRAAISLPDEVLTRFESLFQGMHAEFYEKSIGYAECLRAYAILLLTELARHYFEKAPLSAPAQDNRERVLHCAEYIEENFAEDLSAEELAKWCAMSKTGFFRLFSSLTGETPNAYLHKCRIRAALRYIDKGYKITAVFGLCGYNDFATFYRNFKKIMGCSPEAYKQSRSVAAHKK